MSTSIGTRRPCWCSSGSSTIGAAGDRRRAGGAAARSKAPLQHADPEIGSGDGRLGRPPRRGRCLRRQSAGAPRAMAHRPRGLDQDDLAVRPSTASMSGSALSWCCCSRQRPAGRVAARRCSSPGSSLGFIFYGALTLMRAGAALPRASGLAYALRHRRHRPARSHLRLPRWLPVGISLLLSGCSLNVLAARVQLG